MSLDAVISADLVKTRAEIAALITSLAAARSEIAGLNTQVSGNSVINAVQRLKVLPGSNSSFADVAINPVNQSKALVLVWPSVFNEPEVSCTLKYEFLSNQLLRVFSSFYHPTYGAIGRECQVQIIEFK